MANLYITEQGAVLRKTGDRLIVSKDQETLLDVPCNKIDNVLIFGNVQFTTQAVRELFEHGIELAILTRSGKFIGQISSPVTMNIELRLDQFSKYSDDDFKLSLAKSIVSGKLNNSLNLIRSFSYNHSDVSLTSEMDELQKCILKTNGVGSTDSLMGIEGAGAKSYFAGFRKMIRGAFNFESRKKHPSTDPVNALLSFGYTLVFNEISSLLDGLGFDPYLGYFHSVKYGRASLASDLVEEFRASVDRFTLNMINNRVFKEENFYTNPKGEGVYLKREALQKYFERYEKFINREFTHPATGNNTTLRKCFRIQSEKLAGHIKGESVYKTFTLEA